MLETNTNNQLKRTMSVFRLYKEAIRKVVFISMFLLIPFGSFAVHIAGGEWEYTYQSQFTSSTGQLMYKYLVKYHYYGKCGPGAPAGIVDPTKSLNDIVTNPTTDYARLVNVNPSIPYIDLGTKLFYESVRTLPADCACENGNLNGYREYVFSGLVDIPATGQWNFNLQDYNRTSCNSNGVTGFFVDAYLNLNIASTHNNSVKFSNPLMIFPIINQAFTYNFGAHDVDNDSLYYEIVAPQTNAGVGLAYNTGYSYTSPFGTAGTITIDHATGILSGSSSILQTVVMAVKVTEFRNGQKIGSVTRDVQISVVPGSNANPLLSGINNTTQYTIQAVAGTQLCFNVNSSDPNQDHVTLSTSDLASVLPTATFSVTNNTSLTPTATICWTPTASDLGKQYCFTIRAEDDACRNPNISPPTFNGVTIKYYCITVNAKAEPCCQNPVLTVSSQSSTRPGATIAAGQGKTDQPIVFCNKENLLFKIDSCGCSERNSEYVSWTSIFHGQTSPISHGCTFTKSFADTGKYTINVFIGGKGCDTVKLSREIIIKLCDSLPCPDCIGSFSPEPGQKYVLSAWVKQENATPSTTTYPNPQIFIEFTNLSPSTTVGPFTAKGDIIDGWQRIEEEFTIPSGAAYINIKLKSLVGNCFFDDIRIHPFKGSMKSYVYDPITLKLSAELDERNYATQYEYDEEGKLIRVKKETEKGVMTIQENKNSTKKK